MSQQLSARNLCSKLFLSYKRHRFHPSLPRAVLLYFTFPLSLRLVEEMLLERSIVVSYEAILVWVRSSLLRPLLPVCIALMPCRNGEL
jgi:hypothetical protein